MGLAPANGCGVHVLPRAVTRLPGPLVVGAGAAGQRGQGAGRDAVWDWRPPVVPGSRHGVEQKRWVPWFCLNAHSCVQPTPPEHLAWARSVTSTGDTKGNRTDLVPGLMGPRVKRRNFRGGRWPPPQGRSWGRRGGGGLLPR